MSNFNNRQLTILSRHNGNIRAFRILGNDGNRLEIRIPGETERSTHIPIISAEDFAVGKYVDLIFSGTYYKGSLISWTIQFIGRTPEKFIPQNGEDVGYC